jgi:hypothetical protein
VAPSGAKAEDKGLGDNATEIWGLVKDYAKQETVDPLKKIGRFLAYGIPGAICMCLGLLFGTLALLRALQRETGDHLTGSYTWVPYVVTFVVAAAVAGLAAVAISKPFRNEESS